MNDEDKNFLVDVIERQIAKWCDHTGFGADGVLASRIAAAIIGEECLPQPVGLEPVGYWQGQYSKDGGATLYELEQVSVFGIKYVNHPVFSAEQVARLQQALDRLTQPVGIEPVAWEYRTYTSESDTVNYHFTEDFEDTKKTDQYPTPLYSAEQLARVQRERDSNKRQADYFFAENSTLNTKCVNLQAKLEVEQKKVERLLESLDKIARLGNEPYFGNSTGNQIAIASIAATEKEKS